MLPLPRKAQVIWDNSGLHWALWHAAGWGGGYFHFLAVNLAVLWLWPDLLQCFALCRETEALSQSV